MIIYNYLFIAYCVTDFETEMFRAFLKKKTDPCFKHKHLTSRTNQRINFDASDFHDLS